MVNYTIKRYMILKSEVWKYEFYYINIPGKFESMFFINYRISGPKIYIKNSNFKNKASAEWYHVGICVEIPARGNLILGGFRLVTKKVMELTNNYKLPMLHYNIISKNFFFKIQNTSDGSK